MSGAHLGPVTNFSFSLKFLLERKHAAQRGIWVPAQHLLWDQGKPRKTLIELAGSRTFRMQLTSSQQYSIKSANPNISLYSLLLNFSFLFFFFLFFFSFVSFMIHKGKIRTTKKTMGPTILVLHVYSMPQEHVHRTAA
jgi:hypothetical protein